MHRERKRSGPNTWKKFQPTIKRLKGQAFSSNTGKEIPEKTMGIPCTSEFCRKIKLRACNEIPGQERSKIFKKFWNMSSWEERRSYVQTLVHKVEVKQPKSPTSRRNVSMCYNLQLEDGTTMQVCKKMFSSTIGVPKRTIGRWLCEAGRSPDHVTKPKSPKTGSRVHVSEDDITFLENWLNALPTTPSHYCRSSSTYQDKKYLHPGTKILQLFNEYGVAAREAQVRIVARKYFTEVFHRLNFSVFIPRKDQCDVCVAAKYGNVEKEKHNEHILEKDRARAQKSSDKESASEKVSVWTMDLQAVLLCPQTKASSMYYRTKFQVHNFTLYNLQTKDGYCYTWDESQGDLSSEVFAHIQYQHFRNVLEEKRSIKH